MDTMDFVKRAWASLDLSSPFTPTLSVEELDKRIADLRAVEQWLALNQGMLRNTIQGLEIQRGALHARDECDPGRHGQSPVGSVSHAGR